MSLTTGVEALGNSCFSLLIVTTSILDLTHKLVVISFRASRALESRARIHQALFVPEQVAGGLVATGRTVFFTVATVRLRNAVEFTRKLVKVASC